MRRFTYVASGMPCPALSPVLLYNACYINNLPLWYGPCIPSEAKHEKTALITSVLKHKEASHGRVESLAGDESVAPRHRPRFCAGGMAQWRAQWAHLPPRLFPGACCPSLSAG